MKPGDKVRNMMREKTGVIVSFPQVPMTCTVDYGDGKGPSVTTKAFLELVKSSTPRFLSITKATPEIEDFITYLHTPEANCSLYLEARNPDFEEAIREQYKRLSGEELMLGEGFNVAPHSASKQGSEGSVKFTALQAYPKEIQEMLSPDGTGHINHISFVWLLVEKGFKVSR